MPQLFVRSRLTGEWVPAVPAGVPGPPGVQGPQGPGGVDGDPGEAGGPIPNGGLSGTYLRKSGQADFETEWVDLVPRGVVGHLWNPSITCPYDNQFQMIASGSFDLLPERLYQVVAGIRAIDDTGTDCQANVIMTTSGVPLFDDYFGCTGAGVGLWGTWCQQMIASGADLGAVASPTSITFTLSIKLSVGANKVIYAPYFAVYDVGLA